MSAKSTMQLVIASTAEELKTLLDQVKPEGDHMLKGVLTVAREALPGFIANLRTGVYLDAGLLPANFSPAKPATAGWVTALTIVGEEGRKYVNAPSDETVSKYGEGARWARTQVLETCPARGADTGAEPMNFQIARKADELAQLLDQVAMPDDNLPGGALLALLKFSMPGLARNMNEGLYNAFGLLPPVINPAYLPSKDWEAQLARIRQPAATAVAHAKDPLKYHYNEGVRWTCAKYRDAFRNLSEPARHR